MCENSSISFFHAMSELSELFTLEDFKPAYAVLHLILIKIKNHWVRGAKQDLHVYRFTKLWNFNFHEKKTGVRWWYMVKSFNLVGAYCRFSQLMY